MPEEKRRFSIANFFRRTTPVPADKPPKKVESCPAFITAPLELVQLKQLKNTSGGLVVQVA